MRRFIRWEATNRGMCMSASTDTAPTGASRLTLRAVWAVVLGVAVLTRLVDLGRQAPWLDEILNWQLAEIYGFRLRPTGAHQLSYVCQSLGLLVSDSAFGLRLYSALFGVGAVAAATAWARARLGPLHALCVGLLLALSPFGIFYSQDANHYAPLMLAGVLAAVSVDWFMAGERLRYAPAVLAAMATALAIGFHPLGLLPIGAMALTGFVWKLVHAERLPLGRMPVRTRRLLLLLGGAVLAAVAAPYLLGRAIAHSGLVVAEGRRLGLEWEPWRALLGDLYGALYHHKGGDTLLGVTGAAASLAGYALLARRRPWAAAGAAAVVVIAVLPFLLFTFSHYFSPRYLAAAQPVLLLGVGVLAAEAVIARRRVLPVLLAVWGVVFLVRVGVWELSRLHRDHQPTRDAIAWIRESTPPDAIVLTRQRYCSRAMRFLWERQDMGARTLVALEYIPFAGGPAIQQAEELLAESGVPVYFLTLSDDELTEAPGFAAWLHAHGELAARFRSGTPDSYDPIDWSIPVFRLRPSDGDPFALPRDGNRPSALFAGWKAVPLLRPVAAEVGLPAGASATYRVRGGVPGVAIHATVTRSGAGPGPDWVAAGIPGGAWRLWDLRAAQGTIVLHYDEPLPDGVQQLEVAVIKQGGGHGARTQHLLVRRLEAWDGGAVNGALPAVRLEPVELRPAENGDGARALERRLYDLRDTPAGDIELSQQALALDGAPRGPVLVIQRLHAFGLGDRALLGHAWLGPAQVHVPQIDWTSRSVVSAAVFESPSEDGELRTRLRLLPAGGERRPVQPEVTLEPLEVYGRSDLPQMNSDEHR